MLHLGCRVYVTSFAVQYDWDVDWDATDNSLQNIEPFRTKSFKESRVGLERRCVLVCALNNIDAEIVYSFRRIGYQLKSGIRIDTRSM